MLLTLTGNNGNENLEVTGNTLRHKIRHEDVRGVYEIQNDTR